MFIATSVARVHCHQRSVTHLAALEGFKAGNWLILLPDIPHTHTAIQATACHLWWSIPLTLQSMQVTTDASYAVTAYGE